MKIMRYSIIGIIGDFVERIGIDHKFIVCGDERFVLKSDCKVVNGVWMLIWVRFPAI